jgi:isopentenyl-diphosphate delta-isomerase
MSTTTTTTITESPAVTAAKAYLASIDLSGYDAEQSRLMAERCILVDEQDNAIGAVDKKTCMSLPSSPLTPENLTLT